MQKLDHMLQTGSTLTIPEEKKKSKPSGIPGMISSFVALGIGTWISLGFILPEINKTFDSGMIGEQTVGLTRTVMNLMPLMIGVTLLLIIVGIIGGIVGVMGGSKEEDDGSETKKTEGA